MAAGVLSKMT